MNEGRWLLRLLASCWCAATVEVTPSPSPCCPLIIVLLPPTRPNWKPLLLAAEWNNSHCTEQKRVLSQPPPPPPVVGLVGTAEAFPAPAAMFRSHTKHLAGGNKAVAVMVEALGVDSTEEDAVEAVAVVATVAVDSPSWAIALGGEKDADETGGKEELISFTEAALKGGGGGCAGCGGGKGMAPAPLVTAAVWLLLGVTALIISAALAFSTAAAA
jgi:hypothetical protein